MLSTAGGVGNHSQALLISAESAKRCKVQRDVWLGIILVEDNDLSSDQILGPFH